MHVRRFSDSGQNMSLQNMLLCDHKGGRGATLRATLQNLKEKRKMQPFKFEGLQVGLRFPCLVLKMRIPGNPPPGGQAPACFAMRFCGGSVRVQGGSVEDEKNRDSAPLLIFSAPPADRAPLLKSNHFQC